MEATLYASEVQDLANFFMKVQVPDKPIKISPQEMILNPQYFVNGHFQYLVSATPTQIERDTFLPYLERLKEFKKFLQGQI